MGELEESVAAATWRRIETLLRVSCTCGFTCVEHGNDRQWAQVCVNVHAVVCPLQSHARAVERFAAERGAS